MLNVRTYGKADVVDLVIGDARQTMLPVLANSGFSLAFLDVDVYEVTRDLLFQLWRIAKGSELIIIHDADSPGIRKALDEFHAMSGNTAKEYRMHGNTVSKLELPRSLAGQ